MPEPLSAWAREADERLQRSRERRAQARQRERTRRLSVRLALALTAIGLVAVVLLHSIAQWPS